MNGAGTGTFYKVPVSKVIIVVSAVASLVATSQGLGNSLNLSLERVVDHHEWWRVLSSCFVFESTAEALFGLGLIYQFRIFERQYGSNKYAVFAAFSLALSCSLQLFSLWILRDKLPDVTPLSGPLGLIFSAFVHFCFDVPATSRFSLFGINVSNKALVYVAGMQLLLSGWTRSLLPVACGIIPGILYRVNLFGIKSLRVPGLLCKAVSLIFSPLFASATAATTPVSLQQQQQQRQGQPHPTSSQTPVRGRLTEGLMPDQPPSDAEVEMLTSMGFGREDAEMALLQAGNDVHQAIHFLVESQNSM